MSVPEALDARELVGELPAFAILPAEVRALVVDSFEPVSFPFGAVIVREGDAADAFYVLAAGSARVVKQGEHGEEVALNVLRRGDSFGEMALLDGDGPHRDRAREQPRAGAPARQLGLHGPDALPPGGARGVPDDRGHAVALELLPRALELRATLERGARVARLGARARQRRRRRDRRARRRPARADVRDRAGPRARLQGRRGRGDAPRVPAHGRLLRRALAVPRASRAPRASQAVSDCTLLRFPTELFRRLLAEHPDFRLRLEQRIQQYDYRRVANVPLDFAEELLPADALLQQVSPEQVEPELDAVETLDETDAATTQRPIRRFPHVYQLDEMDCGAACLAMICRHFGRAVAISHIRELVHTSTDGTTLAGITGGANELGLAARSVRASKSRLDDLPLPAVVHWEGNHWVVAYRVDDKHVRVADPARGLRRIPREEFLQRWSGYTSVVGYTERLARRAGGADEPRLGQAVPAPASAARALRRRARDRGGDARARAADPDPGRRRPRPAAREPPAALDPDGGDHRRAR